jgi:hypothetical protein
MYPYPATVFQVNLTPPTAEAMGPLTNQSMQGTDSPDNIVDADYQTIIDSLKANRVNTRSTSAPFTIMTDSGNVNIIWHNNNLKHGDILVAYGQKAIYMRKMYCNAANGGEATYDRAILTCLFADLPALRANRTSDSVWPD